MPASLLARSPACLLARLLPWLDSGMLSRGMLSDSSRQQAPKLLLYGVQAMLRRLVVLQPATLPVWLWLAGFSPVSRSIH